jgi:hypothetical protein
MHATELPVSGDQCSGAVEVPSSLGSMEMNGQEEIQPMELPRNANAKSLAYQELAAQRKYQLLDLLVVKSVLKKMNVNRSNGSKVLCRIIVF